MQFLPTPITKVPLTPLIGDVLVVEHVDTKVAGNATHPTYGDAHPNTARWPDHKFCWAESGEKGLQTWNYVADRATQHLYNWEQDDAKEWPSVRQTFLIPRAEFVAGSVTYAPPDHLSEDYVITATTQVRSDMAKLDNLYVVVLVEREDTSALQLGQEFDADTGTLREYTKQKVPAGTAGSFDPETGTIAEIQPINSFWSIKTVKQAQGMAGNAVGGVYTRPSYYVIVNYSWPGVLNPFQPFSKFSPPLKGGGYDTAIITHNYLRYPYEGPCVAEIIEEWTQNPPTVTTIGSTMQPKEIRWAGRLLDIYVPPTLHNGGSIFESAGTDHPKYSAYSFEQWFPGTTPTDWPTFIDHDKTVRPYFGGYISRKVRVYNPYVYELASDVKLSAVNITATSAFVSWATGVPGTASVYIRAHGGSWAAATATEVAGAVYTFTGLAAGTAYDIKVVVGAYTSNTAEISTQQVAPVITTSPITITALEGAAVSSTVAATGGGVEFSASGLLTGLSVHATTGVISGTPSDILSGASEGSVSAANDAGSDSEPVVFSYTAKPTITAGQAFSFTTGVVTSHTAVVSNSPSSWALASGSLPAGVTFTSGVFSGTATTPGSYPVTITATNAAGVRTAVSVALTVVSVPAITNGAIPAMTAAEGTAGVTPALTLVATGGSIVYSATGLPAGLTINSSTGVVGGTPTSADSDVHFITLTATNAAGAASRNMIVLTYTAKPTITVSESGPTYSIAVSQTGVSISGPSATNSPASWALATSGLCGDYTAFMADHNLVFDTGTGGMTGDSLTTVGYYTLYITATNAAGTRAAVAVVVQTY